MLVFINEQGYTGTFLRDGEKRTRQPDRDIIGYMERYIDREGSMIDRKGGFEKRLNKYPYLKSRFESILDVVEDKSCSVDKADEAEELLIEEIRQLGGEALHTWAMGKEEEKVKGLLEDKKGMKRQGKKKFGGTRHLEK